MRIDCDTVAANDLTEKYILGELDPAERDAYELHYFECERCFSDLKRLRSIQQALRERTVAAPVRVSPPARAVPWRWIAAGAAAASIGVLVLVPQFGMRDQVTVNSPLAPHPSTIEPAVPGAAPERADDLAKRPVPMARGPSAPSASPDSRFAPSVTQRAEEAEGVAKRPTADRSRRITDALRRLASVSPPSYRTTVLRGATDEATARFRAGMRAYGAGDYRAAVTELQRAAREDPERPDIPYFLGISQLMVGDIAGAIDELRRTVALGESPFLGDAHFYLAKAHLAQAEVAAARSELETAAALEGDRRSEAGRLLAELNHLDLR